MRTPLLPPTNKGVESLVSLHEEQEEEKDSWRESLKESQILTTWMET